MTPLNWRHRLSGEGNLKHRAAMDLRAAKISGERAGKLKGKNVTGDKTQCFECVSNNGQKSQYFKIQYSMAYLPSSLGIAGVGGGGGGGDRRWFKHIIVSGKA